MRTFTAAFSPSVQHKFHASKDYNQSLEGGGVGEQQHNNKKTPQSKPNQKTQQL